jgi:hypothetical protein
MHDPWMTIRKERALLRFEHDLLIVGGARAHGICRPTLVPASALPPTSGRIKCHPPACIVHVWGDLGVAKSVAATLAVNDFASFYSQTNGDWTLVGASQPMLSKQSLEPSVLSIGLGLLVGGAR